ETAAHGGWQGLPPTSLPLAGRAAILLPFGRGNLTIRLRYSAQLRVDCIFKLMTLPERVGEPAATGGGFSNS
ncbi:MAG: hypothetical protein LUG45_06560, partial [Clostridiales bacterium]|nr:hypothetical protein [Clostridiales bacterium]